MPRIIDWSARMEEMVEFVGLRPAELELVRATGPAVSKHADALTGAVYDNFLQFPETRRFFAGPDGDVNEERLARRKHTLARWLRGSIEFKADTDFPIRVLAMAVVHSHPPSHRAHLGSIPSRYMIGTISVVQSALAEALAQELDDPAVAMQASIAWNKLLMVQLDILLAGYVTETPTEPAPAEAEKESHSS